MLTEGDGRVVVKKEIEELLGAKGTAVLKLHEFKVEADMLRVKIDTGELYRHVLRLLSNLDFD
jgi:tryptophan 2,3-dioxygenase